VEHQAGPPENYVIHLPALQQAIELVGWEKAVALFEREDIDTLIGRQVCLAYLTNEPTPFYAWQELEDITKFFLSYLKDNETPLITTGWPEKRFADSSWLHMLLSTVYPARPVPEWDEGCVPDLKYGDMKRLTAGRKEFFNLKVGIINELLSAVQARKPEGLREKCRELLTDALLADDVEFYLRIDESYARCYLEIEGSLEERRCPRSGGLTALLHVIGHYEKELCIGALAKTREKFLSLPTKGSVPSYYEAAEQPWREKLDDILDQYISLESKAESFLGDYRKWIDEALRDKFKTKVTIEVTMEKKFERTYKDYMTHLNEFAYQYLKAHGKLPQITISEPTADATPEDNVFRKEGRWWKVVYEGKEGTLQDTVGIKYIHYLVQRPHELVFVLDLVGAVTKRGGTSLSETYGKMGKEELGKLGMEETFGLGDAGPRLEGLTKSQLIDWREELEKQSATQNPAEALETKEKMEQITKELSRRTNKTGKSRKEADPVDKARKAVTKAINFSLKEMKAYPCIFEHFNSAIKKGTNCSYCPIKPTAWSF
jgi:hypothetical protein